MTDVPPPPPPPQPPSDSFGAPPPGAGGPDVGAALSYGWKKFTENALPLILLVILPALGLYILFAIGLFAVKGFFGIVLFEILGFLAYTVLLVGIYRASLGVTTGEKADIGKAYQYDNWGGWIVFSIVYGLAIGIGFALCIIPGLFALAFWGLAPFYVIDQNMGIGDAFKASANAASKKGLAFPVLLCYVIGWLGSLACGIGALITVPLAFVAVSYLYRYANNQPVAA